MSEIIYVDFGKRTVVSKKEIKYTPSVDDLAKKEHFAEAMKRGKTLVVVDTISHVVKIPEYLKGNPALAIAWSHKFAYTDLVSDDRGVRGTLHFKRKPHFVDLPWESIWMIYREEEGQDSSKIWQAAAPKDFLELAGEIGDS